MHKRTRLILLEAVKGARLFMRMNQGYGSTKDIYPLGFGEIDQRVLLKRFFGGGGGGAGRAH